MKNKFIPLLAIVSVLALSSCGKEAEKSGIITESTNQQISITATDGTVYKYTTDDKTKFENTSDALGDTVEVVSGSYKDGVHADSIKLVKAAEATPVPIEIVYGTIKDGANASITITGKDNKDYLIQKDDNTMVQSPNGIVIGDEVEITYIGSLDDNSAVAQDIIVIEATTAQPAQEPAKTEEAAQKNETQNDTAKKETTTQNDTTQKQKTKSTAMIKYATGTCKDMMNQSIRFNYNGTIYNIAKSDNTYVEPNIGVGDTIRIYHTGSLRDGMFATKVFLIKKANETENSDKNNSTIHHKIKGDIVDASNANVIIRTADGTQMDFHKNDNTKIHTDMQIGTNIEVYYVQDGDSLMATTIN